MIANAPAAHDQNTGHRSSDSVIPTNE
jgi:hypothetical protein